MHRCWDVPELTRLIVESIDDHDPDTNRWQSQLQHITLARLALTCQKISGTSLDVLWEEHYGYVNLLKALPAEKYRISDNILTIIEPELEDWDRVLSYSRRIKTFSDVDYREGCPVPDMSVLESMTRSLPAGALLPHVRYLFCSSSSPLFSLLPSLIGTRVSSIMIELTSCSWRFSVVQELALPCVTSVTIVSDGGVEGERVVTKLISDFVRCESLLRKIDVDRLTFSTLLHSSNLKHLEHLDTSVITGDLVCSREDMSVKRQFPALLTLSLRTPSPSLLAKVVEITTFPLLEQMWLYASNLSLTFDPTALLSSTGAHSSSDHLTSLIIALGCNLSWGEHQVRTLSALALKPLLELSNLSWMELYYPGLCPLDDAFVESMARAWPGIQKLHIECQYDITATTSPTMQSLVSLSQHCPLLVYLRLDVDATKIPSARLTAQRRALHRKFSLWEVRLAPIESAHKIATFLSAIFPRLQMVCYSSPSRKEWDEVSRLISAFAEIRADERHLIVHNGLPKDVD
ncbi:hypothetical protein R3P38DRAFT_2575817 [Favolaschia claudopus]|uniref:F-box domain-containing protein n=2 Tax=Favolaschia claudopus TaxID=2862362 RepID=A0AAV9ZJR3_9AGAR